MNKSGIGWPNKKDKYYSSFSYSFTFNKPNLFRVY